MTQYTEDTLVQRTTAEYLEQQLGWESVYAYNTETFGFEGTLGRGSDCEVVLIRYRRLSNLIRICQMKLMTMPCDSLWRR